VVQPDRHSRILCLARSIGLLLADGATGMLEVAVAYPTQLGKEAVVLRHIGVVAIPVTDQDQAVRFFVDVLGMETRTDAAWGEGQRWVEVAPPGAQTTLSLYTWYDQYGVAPGGYTGVLLECDDLNQLYQAWKAKGVGFQGAPFDSVGGRFVTFVDPFGNQYLLHQTTG
jgi:catechol 2,3-dioxygenase-like lactoylglutathione lyase family enzyme